MLDIAQAMAHSARLRTESRGSHQRTDYPARDDKNFLRHSMALQDRWRTAHRLQGRCNYSLATRRTSLWQIALPMRPCAWKYFAILPKEWRTAIPDL